MYSVIPNKELRKTSRGQLKGNWGGPILACLLYSVILMAIAFIPVAGSIISLIVAGPFVLGVAIYFLKFVRGEQPKVDVIFGGFKTFGKSLGLYLLMILYVLLWTLLLIVPGIIMSFAYSQAFLILADNPDMKVTDALKTSKAMMQGYKMKFFLLGLSFIGWALLGILTLCIGYLWLTPYMEVAYINFYEDVRKAYAQKQLAEV